MAILDIKTISIEQIHWTNIVHVNYVNLSLFIRSTLIFVLSDLAKTIVTNYTMKKNLVVLAKLFSWGNF